MVAREVDAHKAFTAWVFIKHYTVYIFAIVLLVSIIYLAAHVRLYPAISERVDFILKMKFLYSETF